MAFLRHRHTYTVMFVLAFFLFVVAAEDAAGLSWRIYHSWNLEQQFVRRGRLTWRPENSDAEGADVNSNKNPSFVFEVINDDQSANLTAKDIRDMLEYGWYHVKIEGDSFDGNNMNDNFVFQTVPACNLRRANFKDQFDITLPRSSIGDRQDPMTSFAYTPLVSPLAPKFCNDYDDDETETKSFSSKVSVQLDQPAPQLKTILSQSKPPPGLTFMKQPQQLGGNREQGGEGSGSENYDGTDAPPNPIPSPFSFLQKYWYIILPMVILQLIQAPAPEEQQQQGPAQPGSSVGAASTTGVDQKNARRGKRSNKKTN